jgi:7,8-dihydro-6-hydroxymethylpterin-pyrophosphokinase
VDAAERLPRPALFTVPFVLGPLAELAPDLVHPVTGERCSVACRALDRGTLRNEGVLR